MSALFAPGWGNYAIRGIVEIEVPADISLRPQTPGWWLLLALLLGLCVYQLWRRWQNYRSNRYRREALVALHSLEERSVAGDRNALRELAPLLRAVALHAAPRTRVAASDGEAWARLLEEMAPQAPPLPLEQLHLLAYAPLPEQLTVRHSSLFPVLEQWIQEHQQLDA
ncbi:MAG: hypothetical protein ACI87W_002260 [Halieaceae bacterium]|jgi:hypothetical protein